MTFPTEKEWGGFQRIQEDPKEVPLSKDSTRVTELPGDSESAAMISMMEVHQHLSGQTELCPGRRLANRYVIKEKIGEGGMGVVYEAVQEMTQQEVALKVIHPALVSPPLIKRFQEEIRALGKLQHDYIVRVFDADYDHNALLSHDLLFYAMQLVRGLPLIRWANESHPTVEARLECFIQICEAVDYAHGQHVIHRDLKPDNILVNAGGRPAILDFGLAQIMDLAFDVPTSPQTHGDLTIQQLSGTPAFMARERWEGHSGGIPGDIFALGVLLHEVLTGTRPWRVGPDASVQDLYRAIRDFSSDELEEHPAFGRPMLRLLGSMLSPNPATRPASAAEVAGALRAILKRRRLMHRIRRTAPIWAGVAVAVGSVIATQSYYAWRKRLELESEHRLVQATQIVKQQSEVDTLAKVVKLLPEKPQSRHSQDKWRDVVVEAMATWNLRDLRAVQLPNGFEPQTANVQGTRFFGRTIIGEWELIQRADDAWVSTRFPGKQDFLRARINPRHAQLATLTATGGLEVWQWNQNRHIPLLPSAETDAQFEFSPNGRFIACSATILGPDGVRGDRLSAVRVFDTQSWKEVALLFKPGGEKAPGTFIYLWSRPIAGLAFSPDGNHLAAWSDESSNVLIWQWADEQLVHLARHPDRLAAVAWRPDPTKREFATIQPNGQVRVWTLPQTSTPGVLLEPGDEWEASPDFQGHLAWVSGGEALAAVDQVKEEMQIFAAGTGEGGLNVKLGNPNSGGMSWLSGGLLRSREGRREWVPLDLDPPVRRMVRIPGFSPNQLSFNPAGTLLAAADNTRVLAVATISGEIKDSLDMPLSGPIAFDPATGDLWTYNKTSGPNCWANWGSLSGMNYVPRAVAVAQNHVGQLAAAGGHLVFSRGTNIFICTKDGVFDNDKGHADITVDAPPQQLAISPDGQQVAALWSKPVLHASLFRKGMEGWISELMITNAPVVANLPEWDQDAPLTLLPPQQRTAAEKALESRPTHFGDTIVLTPASRVPLVAWFRGLSSGVHLDYVGREDCIHLATLPYDREHGRHTAVALSPDGMWLATANSKGEIHIWDLRRTLRKLAELPLGVDEIHPEQLGHREGSPKFVKSHPPG